MKHVTLVVVVALASAAAGAVAGATLFRRATDGPPDPPQRKILYYRDPMNPARTSPVPRKDEMGMDFVPVHEGEASSPAGGRGVYVDARMAQSSGVREEEVRTRRLTRTIRTVGRVTYDERRLHDLNAKVMGWIEKLYVDYTGKPVRRGEPLMAIHSPSLVATREEYLLALRHRGSLAKEDRETDLPVDAEALVQGARRRLRYFDIPESEIRELERRGRAKKTLTLRSPADGYVVEKSVVEGTQVNPGTPLFKIADLSNVLDARGRLRVRAAMGRGGLGRDDRAPLRAGKDAARARDLRVSDPRGGYAHGEGARRDTQPGPHPAQAGHVRDGDDPVAARAGGGGHSGAGGAPHG